MQLLSMFYKVELLSVYSKLTEIFYFFLFL